MVQEMSDPSVLDVLLLIDLEIRNALFMNMVQVKSEQLVNLMEKKSVMPTGICYLLDPSILHEERSDEKDAIACVCNNLTALQRQNYMDKYAPNCPLSAESFLIGNKRLISYEPIAKWAHQVYKDKTFHLDDCKWELLFSKPISHSESFITETISTGKST
jgi:hypothetical protein